MGEITLRPDACIRCNRGDEEMELGHALCKKCMKALENPPPVIPEPKKCPGPRMTTKPMPERAGH